MTNKVPKSQKNKIEIDNDNPFKNCKLDREKYADVLTNIVKTYKDGFVLAINNKWGTGKTTFLKMWQKDLENNKFQVLHFNAWKTDFSSNPFIALISQLGILKSTASKEIYNSFLDKGVIFVKKLGPGLLKGLAKKHIDDEQIHAMLSAGVEITADSLEQGIKKQHEIEQDIDDFRSALSELVRSSSKDKPIVFIVDELDRCRPDYAVLVLEQIKHFFSVDGIVFVLAIDKVQLGHAIRGVYGSEKLDADEYLRRFIDLEYVLQEPEIENYINYMYDYYRFDDFMGSQKRTSCSELNDERLKFKEFLISFFTINHLSLRVLEKIFFHGRIVMNTFKHNQSLHPELFIYLLFIKFTKNTFYTKLKNLELNLDEIAQEYESHILKKDQEEKYRRKILLIESRLLGFYQNSFNSYTHDFQNQVNCIKYSTNKEDLGFHTSHNNTDKPILKRMLRTVNNTEFGLLEFLEKIDLQQGFSA